MGLRIENVIFYSKNEFLICRGGRFTKVLLTKDGEMVELDGFPNYLYCVRTGEIYRKRGGTEVKLKKHFEGSNAYYYLYLNGQKSRVYHLDMLAKNKGKILNCVSDMKKNRNDSGIKN